jgi:hypothetical protein
MNNWAFGEPFNSQFATTVALILTCKVMPKVENFGNSLFQGCIKHWQNLIFSHGKKKEKKEAV